jgi:hypothetical protein
MKLPSGPLGTMRVPEPGARLGDAVGQADIPLMSCELGVVHGRPCDLLRVC